VGILASTHPGAASEALWATNTTFAYRVSHPAAPFPAAVLENIANGDPREFEDDGVPSEKAYVLPVTQPTHPRLTRTGMCHAVASAARANNLPVPFFTNLIWQESAFNPKSVSPVGAQGVAQFMPGTAKEYGLNNPFEPIQALHAAGRFLGKLLSQFGNLGLAAAAYNAGPGRVSDFMNKGRKLPDETKNYVVRITGRSADRWTSRSFARGPEARVMPVKAPCSEAVEEAAVQAKAAEEARVAAAATLAARGVKQARKDGSRRRHDHTVRTALVRAKGKPDAAARKAASLKVADRTSEKRAGRASRSETKTAAKTHASQKRTHVADAR
jgi:hypothetical protein